jgi:aspartate--ammonia ligase
MGKNKMTEIKLPKNYKSKLSLMETEVAIKFIKDTFQAKLAQAINLKRVSAPLFLESGSGVNDDLNGTERKAEFILGSGKGAEAPNSLAKWKRMKLAEYEFKEGEGLYTDMNGIRLDDPVDPLHSHYVDQWDWEKVMSPEDRKLDYLKETVRKIYGAIKETVKAVEEKYPDIKSNLPEDITFVHTEELYEKYPDATPKERETVAAKKHGAIFIIGIGSKLPDGKLHDGRAPDYDDWITDTEESKKGLNGDIVLYYPVLDLAFEVSSMGIRVSPESMKKQIAIRIEEAEADGQEDLAAGYKARLEKEWHKKLLAGEFPQTIGGGIGQSRLCMFFLQKAHIGEVQASIWPDDMKKECEGAGIRLL